MAESIESVANQGYWPILGDFGGFPLPDRVGRQGIEIEEYWLWQDPKKNNKKQVEARGNTGRTHRWQAFLR